ncbi:DMT family transporter [Streptomyces spirodelae]|uniref:DMT family transporter n=1 Tax=Streptomyces spirodelae TaxID=2812904 RepID=A0ABS3WMF9_9ACTN|nr:DMT family transporter [Streptomyces spirodelae]MBO8184304.1 DMT family transporter [Streptomyces spirodelae]
MAVYVYGLVAACFLGLGFVLQQDAASRAPVADVLSFRLLLDLVRVPRWLLGIASMVVGQLTSAYALMQGELSTVEPLLATNLLFAMVFARRLSSQRLGWSGWGGVVLLSGGVTAFIIAGRPEGTDREAGPLRHWLIFGILVGIALVLVLIARHLELFKEPPLLATAAGSLYGLQDALTRVVGGIYDSSGLVGVLLTWQGYTIVALAVIGLVLVQSAFEGGPLRMSLPSLTASEPLAGIACGIGFLGDSIRLTPGALAGEVIGLLAVVVGVFILGRHPVLPTGKQPGTEEG